MLMEFNAMMNNDVGLVSSYLTRFYYFADDNYLKFESTMGINKKDD